MINTLSLTAGQRVEFYERGDFFRLLAATSKVSVEFYKNGAEVAEAVSIGAGYAEKFEAGDFDRFAIVNGGTDQSIQFVTRLGNTVSYDTPPEGNVAITNTAGPFTHNVHNVTNVSGQLRVANQSRRYLLIQNNDASGDIFVRLDGAAATTSNAVKIPAGGSYELQGFVPNGAIYAIGSIASNTNVQTVEG